MTLAAGPVLRRAGMATNHGPVSGLHVVDRRKMQRRDVARCDELAPFHTPFLGDAHVR